MTNVPDTALGRMYREHIQHILDKNIEALLDQYTDDALLISSFMKKPVVYRGREGLREHMQGILGIEGLETETFMMGSKHCSNDRCSRMNISGACARGKAAATKGWIRGMNGNRSG